MEKCMKTAQKHGKSGFQLFLIYKHQSIHNLRVYKEFGSLLKILLSHK